MENTSKTRLSRQNRGTTGRKLRTPSYRHHKATGRAVVTLGGKDHYLGRYGSAASREAYDRLVAEWLTAGRVSPDRTGGAITVVEVIAAYLRHAKQYYRKPDGTPTSEIASIKESLKAIKRLYGRTEAQDFGPLSLQAVRQTMIASGLSRNVINARVHRIRRMFKWAVGEELVEASVLESLKAVTGLRTGRSEARETEPVRCVPEADVDAIRPYVSPTIWAMIRLQLLTAARPGEIVTMRPCDIDVSGAVWLYRPSTHKNAWRGRDREILIGPRGQSLLTPFLADRRVDACLFSPRDAIAERAALAKTHRRPNQKDTPRKTTREIAESYTVGAYRRAIHRACDRAGVPRWGVNRLRHNAASEIRRTFGLEAAQVMLGHATADVTQVYAERDAAKAVEIASKVG